MYMISLMGYVVKQLQTQRTCEVALPLTLDSLITRTFSLLALHMTYISVFYMWMSRGTFNNQYTVFNL